jgi:hypothetical protein
MKIYIVQASTTSIIKVKNEAKIPERKSFGWFNKFCVVCAASSGIMSFEKT